MVLLAPVLGSVSQQRRYFHYCGAMFIRELTCSSPTIGAVSVVEQLLVAYDSEGPSKFSGALSIRYLGGILELPSFWHNAGDANDYIVGKLCEKLLLILKDLGLESDVEETPCDYIGVDCLADNFLAGILGLRETQSGNDIANKNWYANLLQVVRLLRQPLVGDRLPDSWKRVFSAEFLILIPLIYQQVEVDIVVRYGPEIVHVAGKLRPCLSTHGSSHDQSIPPKEFSDADEGELDGADAESEVGDDDKTSCSKRRIAPTPTMKSAPARMILVRIATQAPKQFDQTSSSPPPNSRTSSLKRQPPPPRLRAQAPPRTATRAPVQFGQEDQDGFRVDSQTSRKSKLFRHGPLRSRGGR
ncbi:hypothetical protein B0H17DRAFT_662518 [Mycena rosella]|uniref:Uncharacterized protein n=1 Tax=Mycena rosella TaxID=1033263 RepID=A0AAD7FF80_MYCRO|nr:hypothetical protein B0H17DRAFT_662518 [Mycena rosella]